ncbi:hypothetical protein SAMN04488564_1011018 [Lentzea waywayandensis]|uniref:Uncharacterized protein n=1 Tax=Lentzea waywayandensis TaxID=84724 RepID=A0A1I6D3N5_9PSEU|nr:hypothetical protein [Lentzea waywayandensis]SFR00108.1 hypothetical protein SAMN04488564_1011018 [Lentzea waywayandensis]
MTIHSPEYASSPPSSPDAAATAPSLGRALPGWIVNIRAYALPGFDSYLDGLDKTATPRSRA